MTFLTIGLKLLCTFLLASASTTLLSTCSLRINTISIPPAILLLIVVICIIVLCWKFLKLCITVAVLSLLINICFENNFFQLEIPEFHDTNIANYLTESDRFTKLASSFLPESPADSTAMDVEYTHRMQEDDDCEYVRLDYFFSRSEYEVQSKSFFADYELIQPPASIEDRIVYEVKLKSSRTDIGGFCIYDSEERCLSLLFLQDPDLEEQSFRKVLNEWHFK